MCKALIPLVVLLSIALPAHGSENELLLEAYKHISHEQKARNRARNLLIEYEKNVRSNTRAGSRKQALALFNAGWAYSKLSLPYEALQLYVEVQSAATSVFDEHETELADLILVIGEGFMSSGTLKAEPLLTRALRIYQTNLGPDSWFVARTLEDLGTLHRLHGNLEDAEPILQQALNIYDKLSQRDDQRYLATMRSLAWLYQYQGRFEDARAAWEAILTYVESRETLSGLQCSAYWQGPLVLPVDRTTMAECPGAVKTWRGAVMRGLGDLHRFFERYDEAYDFYRTQIARTTAPRNRNHTLASGRVWMDVQLGKHRELADLIARNYQSDLKDQGYEHPSNAIRFRDMADLSWRNGNYENAVESLKHALNVYVTATPNEIAQIAFTLNMLADVHRRFGNYADATATYQKARNAYAQIDFSLPNSESFWQDQTSLYMGKLEQALGLYEEAERSYLTSLRATEKFRGASSLEAARLRLTVAEFYAAIHDYGRALPYLDAYLVTHRRFWGETGSIARYEAMRARWEGKLSDAIAHMERAVAWTDTHHERDSFVLMQLQRELAELYAANNAHGATQKLVKRLLTRRFYRQTDTPEEASLQNMLALAYLGQGKLEAATEAAQEAAVLAARFENPELHWRTEHTLAQLMFEEGDTQAAILFGKQAVNNLQKLRSNLQNLDVSSRQSYLEGRSTVYRHLADRLIDLGRVPEAQQVIKMLKQEELFEYLRRSSQAGNNDSTLYYLPEEAEWKGRYEQIQNELISTSAELKKLRALLITDEASSADRKRARELEADLAIARAGFVAYVADLKEAFRGLGPEKAYELGRKDLDSLRAVQGSLQRLGRNAALIHFLVTPTRVRILVTTPTVQFHRDSVISEQTLNKLVFEFREMLQNRRSAPERASSRLYDALFAPIEDDLREAGLAMLMISPDGALRYLPMHALYDGQQYLGSQYEVALFTPASKVGLEFKAPPVWKVAAFGATRGSDTLAPLPSVRNELDAIVREDSADAKGLFPGIVRIDEDFTSAQLAKDLQPQSGQYNVVHIASHFVFKPGTESDSYLLLGDGQPLTLRDFRAGNFDFHNVDLLTLSACETAFSGAGSEFESFGALAQNQGARSVLATLWPVADKSTAAFMEEFYRRRTVEGKSKAAAIRETQMAFATGAMDPRFAHPYFWAPFVLIGNWL